MKKVFITLLTLISMSVAGAYAQILDHPKSGETLTKTPTIDTSDILYWVGTGSNKAILIVSWDESSPAQSLAWGYRWNGGSKTAAEVLEAIDSADSRLSIDGASSGFINDISYTDASHNLTTEVVWCYTVNGDWASSVGYQSIVNGDVMEWSDGCAFTATTTTPVTDPNATNDNNNDTTQFGSDIAYWIGSGENEAIFIVSWDESSPAQSLAWGYRWNGTKTAAQMLTEIDSADSRLSISGISSGFISDISYSDATYNLSTELYWCYTVDGDWAGGVGSQSITDGNIIEFSDGCGFSSTGYTPVPNPNGTTEDDDNNDDNPTFGSDIAYWIGSGENEAIFIVSWDASTPAQSLAWGYRWNGTKTAAQMLTEIDSTDSRLSISGISSGFISDISYSDATYNLSTELYWCYTVDGDWAGGVGSQTIADGNIIEFSDGCGFSSTGYTPVPNPNGTTEDDDNDTILLADATISADSIIYWVGQGSNEVILAINWNNPDTALAWGFRFDQDSVTVKTIMDSIESNDHRLTCTVGAYGISDIAYTDGATQLSLTQNSYWLYNVNGIGAMLGYDQQYVKNGDFVKWGDVACATIADSVVIDDPTYGSYTSYSYVWLAEINPVSIPEEQPDTYIPVITPEEIVYWVGEGDNQAILTANFVVNQETEEYIGLAWGYRWNSADTVTVAEMLAAIDNADDRFAVTLNNGSINTMSYTDNNYTLSLTTEGYAMYSVNGTFPYDYCNAYVVSNGDVVTVGDYYCGGYTEDTYEGYWKELATQPVSNPNLNRFCGIVGTEGCTAIHYDDNRIKNWATTCTVERGYMDIATAESVVTFGTETNAIGAASETTTNAISLGDGGYAILTFERPITNGEGFDFAVYENSFNDYFLELAFVEVSSDGINFVRFPATSLTPTDRQIAGDGTIDATNINNLAGKYRVGWGTPFDLEELRDSANIDINNITHVKIIDVVGTINPEYATYDAFGNIVNDPYPTNFASGGFDLTGVCVLNEKTVSIEDNIADITIKLYPNPCHNYINIENANNKNISIYNVYGQLISEYTATSDNFVLNTQAWKGGVYVLKIGEQCYRIVKE